MTPPRTHKNYKSSKTDSSNINNDKSHDVQENTKLQEKNKRVFIQGGSIIKTYEGL